MQQKSFLVSWTPTSWTSMWLIFQEIEVVDSPLSDHRIVKSSLTDETAYHLILFTKEYERNSFISLNLEKADWDAFKQNLSDVDWVSLKASCHDENDFPELFRLTLLQFCLQHTPLKPENMVKSCCPQNIYRKVIWITSGVCWHSRWYLNVRRSH